VAFQWISVHTGILGNKRADTLAKQVAGLPQPDAYSKCCRLKRGMDEQLVHSKPGRSMYGHM